MTPNEAKQIVADTLAEFIGQDPVNLDDLCMKSRALVQILHQNNFHVHHDLHKNLILVNFEVNRMNNRLIPVWRNL